VSERDPPRKKGQLALAFCCQSGGSELGHGCGPLGLILGRRLLNLVELLSVVPQDLATDVFVAVIQPALDPVVHLVAVQRGRMREVGLEHDLVGAHLVDQTPRRDLLEPVTGVDIAGKVFGGQHLKVGPLFRHAVAQELIIEPSRANGIQPIPLSTETNLMSG